MSLHRRAARRDSNEKDIVKALKRAGATIARVSGEGLPDLLVVFRGRVYGLEVKTAKGKRTQAQETSQWPIVRSEEDALNAIGAIGAAIRFRAGRVADGV